jgi:isoamylase
MRFDPEVMLLDPHARELSMTEPSCARASSTARSSGTAIGRPRRPGATSMIYELHVKGFTRLHPDVPEGWRGKYLGLTAPAVIEHWKHVGVTAVELLPCQSFLSEAFLLKRGLGIIGDTTPWRGSPHANEFACNDAVAEFKTMVKALHEAGIEVILDVVFNHTAEGNESGPVLNLQGTR